MIFKNNFIVIIMLIDISLRYKKYYNNYNLFRLNFIIIFFIKKTQS